MLKRQKLQQLPRQLFDSQGNRKYLTREERDKFILSAEGYSPEIRTLCGVLAYTGCRISEALNLTVDRIDLEAETVVFESLKKRVGGHFRAVPVPPQFLDTLNLVHQVRARQRQKGKRRKDLLWECDRTTAWRHIKEVMEAAGLTGNPAATPKGLRHCFGVTAVSSGIPLNMVQKWLGHAQLSTTAIYADAVGEEEKSIAAKMWS
jgi:integrase/recombinase XerD